ncbi:hypothetical protein BDZ45DRAFT_633722 [Acephala macrosclerotiorum]|nr:hypothetical protein BDZ45DRAFT_633722 [Acephala macrosclerotiorum]
MRAFDLFEVLASVGTLAILHVHADRSSSFQYFLSALPNTHRIRLTKNPDLASPVHHPPAHHQYLQAQARARARARKQPPSHPPPSPQAAHQTPPQPL